MANENICEIMLVYTWKDGKIISCLEKKVRHMGANFGLKHSTQAGQALRMHSSIQPDEQHCFVS